MEGIGGCGYPEHEKASLGTSAQLHDEHWLLLKRAVSSSSSSSSSQAN